MEALLMLLGAVLIMVGFGAGCLFMVLVAAARNGGEDG